MVINMFLNNSINILARNTITKQLPYRFANNKDQRQFDLIYGVNSVQAALHANRREVYSLMLSDSQHIELSSKAAKLVHIARSRDIPVVFAPKERMSRIVDYQPHQNVILKCSFLKLESWDFERRIPEGISVYCDKITDPQNFGAILRSCLFFGATTVFTGKKNHCPLNSTVSKTSAGAMELMDIYGVTNSTEFMQKWKQNKGTIISTGIDENRPHVGAQDLRQILKNEQASRILLILGSEGFGVSPHLLNVSDYVVTIQRKGPQEEYYHVVDSLNVSAAASALLFQLTR